MKTFATYILLCRITFCGITMKNYVERNISSKSQTTLKYAMKMLSGSSETIIFMFLGVATIHDNHDWNWAFVTLTILFCTVFRIISKLFQYSFPNLNRLFIFFFTVWRRGLGIICPINGRIESCFCSCCIFVLAFFSNFRNRNTWKWIPHFIIMYSFLSPQTVSK